jgi:hypothetical protein
VLGLRQDREVGRKQQIVHETGFEQHHHHRHLLRVAWTALPVNADKAPAPAKRLLDFGLWVDENIFLRVTQQVSRFP